MTTAAANDVFFSASFIQIHARHAEIVCDDHCLCSFCTSNSFYFHLPQIHVGNGEYIHARIFQPLPGQGNVKLHSFQTEKALGDEIEYF